MKEQLQKLITALRITNRLPRCHMKNRQIDEFFAEISRLGIEIDERVSGNIKYREFHTHNEEDFEVLVKVIQTDTSEMIIITADFWGEE